MQQGHSIQRQWRAGAKTHPHLESFGRVSAPGRITDFAALLQTVFSAASHRQPAAGAATPSTPRPRPTRMCRLWVASDMGQARTTCPPTPQMPEAAVLESGSASASAQQIALATCMRICTKPMANG